MDEKVGQKHLKKCFFLKIIKVVQALKIIIKIDKFCNLIRLNYKIFLLV